MRRLDVSLFLDARKKDDLDIMDEHVVESIITVQKYPGKKWRAKYTSGKDKKFLWWQEKGGSRMDNSLPRYFGPLTLHD